MDTRGESNISTYPRRKTSNFSGRRQTHQRVSILRDWLLVTFRRPSIDEEGILVNTAKTYFAWHTLVRSAMHVLAPSSTARYHPKQFWAVCVHDAESIAKVEQHSGISCRKDSTDGPSFLSPPTISPRTTMLGRRSPWMHATPLACSRIYLVTIVPMQSQSVLSRTLW